MSVHDLFGDGKSQSTPPYVPHIAGPEKVLKDVRLIFG
jgi:hypothetical protein